MRVALYCRVSTSDQRCELQRADLTAEAARRGWTVAAEFIDEGFSGKSNNRPAFKRIMAAAQKGAFDVVMVTKIDRWGRSVAHLAQSIAELESYGVRFIATSQGIDTDQSNPMSRLLLHLLGAFAEFERSMIVERTQAGVRAAMEAGKKNGRPKMVIDREGVRTARAEGLTFSQIMHEFGVGRATVGRILAEEK